MVMEGEEVGGVLGGGAGGLPCPLTSLSATAFVDPLFLHVQIHPRLFPVFFLFLLLLRLLSIALLLACLILDIPV